MRKVFAIVRATMLEIGCDALALLITMAALAVSTFAPALHYHQIGEPTRMAREAGLSAILVGGLVFSIFGAVRSIRREIESLTIQMALAHSISRGMFLAAKMLGVFFAYLLFFVTVGANSIVAIKGAQIGALVAKGDVSRVWGPSLATGIAPIILPLIIAAFLNRFARFRFTRTAVILMALISILGVFYRFDISLIVRFFAPALALMPLAIFFICLSGAAASRLNANSALSLSFIVVASSLFLFGSHYLSEISAPGASEIPWGYIAMLFAADLILSCAALLAGIALFDERDLS